MDDETPKPGLMYIVLMIVAIGCVIYGISQMLLLR